MENKVLYIGKSSNEVLASKIDPVINSQYISKVYLIRDNEYPCDSDKLIQFNALSSNKIIKMIKKFILARKLIRREKIKTVISVHLHPHGYIAGFIARIMKIQHIHVINAGHREIWYGGKKAEKRNLKFVKKIDALVVQGSNTKAYLVDHGLEPERIFIIPNSIRDQEKPKNLSIKPRDIDFLTVSRLVFNKRTIQLLEVLDKISSKTGNKINLTIVGDGPEYENIKAWIKSNDNELLSADMTGWLEHKKIKELYQRSKYFMLISDGEGVPRSMLESLAYGCVPIVSNVGDITDYIKIEKNGYLLESNSIDDITNIIEKILNIDTSESEDQSREAFNTAVTFKELNINNKYDAMIEKRIANK